jgi:hypothetical protein
MGYLSIAATFESLKIWIVENEYASSKVERERRGIIDSRVQVDANVKSLAREEIRIVELLNQKTVSLATIEQALLNSENQILAYQTELGTKMTSGLDASETRRVGEIQASIGGMETRSKDICGTGRDARASEYHQGRVE